MKAWIVMFALAGTVGCGGRLADESEDDAGAAEGNDASKDAGSSDDARVPHETGECGYNPYVLVFFECRCLTVTAGYGRAARLYEFFAVRSPFLATLSLFLASRHHEGDTVTKVAATCSCHRADPHLIHPAGDEPFERLLRLWRGRYIEPRFAYSRVPALSMISRAWPGFASARRARASKRCVGRRTRQGGGI